MEGWRTKHHYGPNSANINDNNERKDLKINNDWNLKRGGRFWRNI